MVVEKASEVQASEKATNGKMKMAMEVGEVLPESSFPKRSLELQLSSVPVSRVDICLLV